MTDSQQSPPLTPEQYVSLGQENCQNCFFSRQQQREDADETLVECHRYPPAAIPTTVGWHQNWPLFHITEWCGEFRSKHE